MVRTAPAHPKARGARRLLGLLALIPLVVTAPAESRAADAPPTKFAPLRGPDGKPVLLAAPEKGATAVVFYSSECPISNAYSPTLKRLAGSLPADRVRFVGICVDPDLSDADMLTHARDFGLTFPVARDPRGRLAARLGATVTPEAVVIDDRGAVRYRGRIDDQFAERGKANANPETHELQDALTALLDGKAVAVPSAPAVGCPLPEVARGGEGPTYAADVALILQNNCQQCHRKGQVGPFALETFEQARKRAGDIARVADDRTMPPWKPVPGVGPKLLHDKSLSKSDVATLVAWSEAGAPQGDPADLPPPAQFPDDWALGTPDLVIEAPEAFPIPAEGSDIYRCFVIPTNLPNDVYVSAIEYRPDNRKVVHHMLTYVDVTGEARKKDAADPGLGYSCFSGPAVEIHGDLGGWAPGNEPSRLPDGIGRSLPRGADVIVQVHYHPSGKPETDRSRVGLHFSRKPVRQTFHWAAALDPGLRLPAGESNVESKGQWVVPVAVTAWAVTPHMHLLGRDMLMSVKYPDGRAEELVKIADWDFGWQNTYYFEKPLELPKGTVLSVVAHFDNSEGNPRNPNHPPKFVKWGEATTDEMCIGFLAVTKAGQDLTKPGEQDDLHRIFEEDRKALRERYEAEDRKQHKAGARGEPRAD